MRSKRFYTAQRVIDAYQKECAKWDKAYGEKAIQKTKPCTKRYSVIKKKLTDRMSANLIKTEIKGREDRPFNVLIYPLVSRHQTTYFSTSHGILKNNITAPISKTLKPIIPGGVGPSKLLFVDNDIQLPTSPIISAAP